ncbi:hypothetical protein EVAR_42550_1 [Eumeta japonica]|uniref:Uncharacterized protein n=1 Tax=Eumeta variegata TaxID=151549 RepID=A0A4C1WTC5_EUMVA|nr:hypothetical protein EVAR_42550_1 [Eumeta japonica]
MCINKFEDCPLKAIGTVTHSRMFRSWGAYDVTPRPGLGGPSPPPARAPEGFDRTHMAISTGLRSSARKMELPLLVFIFHVSISLLSESVQRVVDDSGDFFQAFKILYAIREHSLPLNEAIDWQTIKTARRRTQTLTSAAARAYRCQIFWVHFATTRSPHTCYLDYVHTTSYEGIDSDIGRFCSDICARSRRQSDERPLLPALDCPKLKSYYRIRLEGARARPASVAPVAAHGTAATP